ncbi:MarR family EPS-associated transcriptional regulator [Saccharospirillum salsuginis]|uniref:MarR family EPS-associated transcriptional regulator n=1 Tax=Saccharospirillum salsuginis TaxID=418750 RepID=A0A918NDY8_9GAMM|nr:MarR family EPS-associated transcriptional regulator [Saccharospirillum salsuginis]GGX60261.1 MarR family EPS-associated transcriptional regulator [Saccharospirillum salsuginis]
MLNDEIRYKLLKLLESNPNLSQRELAKELGISLGKVNYCLKAVLERGWIKAENFKSSTNKLAYAYVLTPRGLEEKAAVTVRFLKRKLDEHQMIEDEIKRLRSEVEETRSQVTFSSPQRDG